jgi:fucose 4-O-acetylase-like acetyltransferase
VNEFHSGTRPLPLSHASDEPKAEALVRVSAPARLADIERAKGLAIFLVVLGHLSRVATPGNEWYMALKDALYQFHMPFFMCLSGITMYLSYKPISGAGAYLRYVRAKFLRLMPAFLVFGLLVLLGKELASNFVPVDNMHSSLASGAWLILTRPITSSAGFLWYIYTLFLFYAAMPALWHLGGAKPLYLLAPALVLHFLPLDKSIADWFMFSQFAEYLLYLTVGFCIARYYTRWVQFIDRHGIAFLAGFLALLCGFLLYGEATVLGTKTVLGLSAIPALHALVRFRRIERGHWLARLGAYSFTIYLFNLLFIGLVKGVSVKLLGTDEAWFPLLGLAMLASGLTLPIVISRGFLQRVPWLDRMTR